MTTEFEFYVSETTLGMHVTKATHVIDDESFGYNGSLESLKAVPSHVLDSNPRPFRDQDKVRQSMNDDSSNTFLDDIR